MGSQGKSEGLKQHVKANLVRSDRERVERFLEKRKAESGTTVRSTEMDNGPSAQAEAAIMRVGNDSLLLKLLLRLLQFLCLCVCVAAVRTEPSTSQAGNRRFCIDGSSSTIAACDRQVFFDFIHIVYSFHVPLCLEFSLATPSPRPPSPLRRAVGYRDAMQQSTKRCHAVL
ncbi:hypothetical protein Tcan_01860 [Toxocara canis]|uniref:Uncharacterized protein n=2 Tax=Toxocara canis TaxID=6265 RepID=A0A0B2V552_TOXCA|nr:hypothetical protein Tcan_01860 [Toxocara canis]VDM24529.1 unnamed protein product [Toxocara canis]